MPASLAKKQEEVFSNIPLREDSTAEMKKEEIKERKCVVWDLDGTLWDGILLEGDDVQLKTGIKKILQTLDSRGILLSIASKNNYDDAWSKLREFGIEEYFLYPQINWEAKSACIKRIHESLNIGIDSFLFVDDQAFERDEVRFVYPEVLCVDAADYRGLCDLPCLNPRFITDDSQKRRLMYMADRDRKKEEQDYQGPKKNFLASLNIRFTISEAKEIDLKRAEELTVRTNQLNSTGITYGYDQLRGYLGSETHKLFICEMNDRYGDHGKIGLALVEAAKDVWYIRLLLMSCRVMSYGVGTVLLAHIMKLANDAAAKLRADFRHTGRNRKMYVTFRFAGFKETGQDERGNIILENDLSHIQKFPPYLEVKVKEK